MSKTKVDYSSMSVAELQAEQERLSDELLEGNVPCNPEERMELLAQLGVQPDNPTALELAEVEEWLWKKVSHLPEPKGEE